MPFQMIEDLLKNLKFLGNNLIYRALEACQYIK